MDPLDSTAILVRAVESVLRAAPTSPAAARRAELRNAEVPGGASDRPTTGETGSSIGSSQTSQVLPSRSALDGQVSYSPTASIQSSVSPIVDNPQATIRKAEEVLQIAATNGSSVVFRRRIAAAAYLAEIEAQRELARMRREGPAGIRQWFA